MGHALPASKYNTAILHAFPNINETKEFIEKYKLENCYI